MNSCGKKALKVMHASLEILNYVHGRWSQAERDFGVCITLMEWESNTMMGLSLDRMDGPFRNI
jgi:hypothetical protein